MEFRHQVRVRKAPMLRVVENALVPEPVQLSLFGPDKPVSRLAGGGRVHAPAVAVEVRHRLKCLGQTQEQIAVSMCRSRPTLTNALDGKFGLSPWAAARLRESLAKPAYRVLELRKAAKALAEPTPSLIRPLF